jgi:hypothetical protein
VERVRVRAWSDGKRKSERKKKKRRAGPHARAGRRQLLSYNSKVRYLRRSNPKFVPSGGKNKFYLGFSLSSNAK